MVTCYRPTCKALFSGLFTMSGLRFERVTSYYTRTGDVTRSKPTSTWESKHLNLLHYIHNAALHHQQGSYNSIILKTLELSPLYLKGPYLPRSCLRDSYFKLDIFALSTFQGVPLFYFAYAEISHHFNQTVCFRDMYNVYYQIVKLLQGSN